MNSNYNNFNEVIGAITDATNARLDAVRKGKQDQLDADAAKRKEAERDALIQQLREDNARLFSRVEKLTVERDLLLKIVTNR